MEVRFTLSVGSNGGRRRYSATEAAVLRRSCLDSVYQICYTADMKQSIGNLEVHREVARKWIKKTGIRAAARLAGLPVMRVSRFADGTSEDDSTTLYVLLHFAGFDPCLVPNARHVTSKSPLIRSPKQGKTHRRKPTKGA